MEDNQQLQLGAIEPSPVATTPVDDSFEIPPYEGEITIPPVKRDQIIPELVTPMEPEQTQRLGELVGMATRDEKFFTSFERWTPQFFEEHANYVLDKLEGEEESVRRQAILEALSDYDLDVNARIALTQGLTPRVADTNIVLRNAAANLTETEAQLLPSEVFDTTTFDAAEELPTTPVPEYAIGTPEIADELITFRNQLEENIGGLDYLSQFSPLAASYNYSNLVSQMADIVGITELREPIGGDAATTFFSYVSPGTTMNVIAEELELMGELAQIPGNREAQVKYENTVRKIIDLLKKNSGVFSDENYAVAAYVLDRAFPRALSGGDPRESVFEYVRENDAYEAFQERQRLRALPQTEEVKARAAELDAKGYSFRQTARAFATFFDNFGAIDDLIFAGELVKAGAMGGRRLLTNRMALANKAAPTVTARATADTLVTGAPNPITVKDNPVDMLDAVLPSTTARSAVNTNINGAALLDEADEMLAREVTERATYQLYTEQELADAAKEITDDVVSSTTARPATLNIANSTIDPLRISPDVEGVNVRGVFGAASNTPFKSADDALKAGAEMFGNGNFVVLKYSPKNGGQLIPHTGKPTARGKYYFGVNTQVPYQAARTTNQKLIYGDQFVNPGALNRLWWKFKGSGFQPLTSTMSNIFERHWNIAQQNVIVKERGAKQAMLDRLNKVIAPLGNDDYVALNALLARGDAKGKVFTAKEIQTELASLGYTSNRKIEDAYYDMRRVIEVAYRVADDAAYRQAIADGVSEIVGPMGRVGFGKEVEVPSKSIRVFDPTTNTISTVAPSVLKNTMASGGKLVRLRRAVTRAGEDAEHVIVQGTTRMNYPPRTGILNRVDGYIPKVISANYIIYGSRTIDGQIVKEPISTAASASDAEKFVERLTAKGRENSKSRWARYVFSVETNRAARSVEEAGALADDVVQRVGGVVFGQRNAGRLLNASSDLVDNKLNPIEATIRAVDAISYQVTKGDLLRQMEDRAWNLINLTTKLKRFPAEEIPRTLEEAVDVFRRRGLTKEADQINAVIAQGQVHRFMSDSVQSSAEWFWNTVEGATTRLESLGIVPKKLAREAAAYAATAAGQRSSLGLATVQSALYTTFVATNFLFQITAQAMQPLVLLGMTGPRAVMKGYAMGAAAATLHAVRTVGPKSVHNLSTKAFTAIGARLAGVSEKQFSEYYEWLRKSGLLEAVAGDNRLRSFAMDRGVEMMRARVAQRAGRGNGKLARASQKLGAFKNSVGRAGSQTMRGVESPFLAVEAFNQITSSAVLYNSDVLKGVAKPLSNKAYSGQLTGRTKDVTGSMLTETGYGFSRGWFRLATSFIAFPMKMTQLVLPEMLSGNRSYTMSAKLGTMAGTMLMYGAAGAPGMDQLVRMIDGYIRERMPTDPAERSAFEQAWFHPMTRAAINGFLIDTLVNQGLTLSTDQDVDLAISEKLSPLGAFGFVAESFTKPFLNPEGADMLELVTGLSYGQGSKAIDYLKLVRDVTLGQLRDVDNVDFGQRLEQLTKEGAALTVGQYRRELALEIADAADGFVVSGGMVEQAVMNDVERTAYRLLGIHPRDRQEYYRMREEYRTRRSFDTVEGRDAEAQQYADDYTTALLRTNAMWHDDNTPSERIDNLMEDWTRQQGLMFSVAFNDDPQMARMINEKVISNINAIMEKGERTRAEQQFMEYMVGRFEKHDLTRTDGVKFINYIQDNDVFTPAQKAVLIDAFDQMTEREEGAAR